VIPLKNLSTAQSENGDQAGAIETLRRAERISPLDWSTHWSLAALLLEEKAPDDAWREFRVVAALLPYMDWIIEREGYFWIPLNPGKAVYAWSEAMRRTTHKRRLEMYAGFLRASAKAPDKTLSVLVRSLYPDDPEIEFIRIKAAGPQGRLRVPRLLQTTGNLADAPDHMIDPLLRYMLDNGMGAEVEALAAQQARIKRLGWFTLAEKAAREGNLAEAVELRLQYGPRPALPAPISRSDLRSIERAAALAPMDITTAIAYYQALSSARRDDEAFRQLRRIMDSPNAPAYIWYLAARSAHERGRHDEAWEYLRTHEKKSAR
jgi:tetratricopeptide (TPR) repeat protein